MVIFLYSACKYAEYKKILGRQRCLDRLLALPRPPRYDATHPPRRYGPPPRFPALALRPADPRSTVVPGGRDPSKHRIRETPSATRGQGTGRSRGLAERGIPGRIRHVDRSAPLVVRHGTSHGGS